MAVDDDPLILSALRRCLHHLQCDFAAFASPITALAALRSREPDLIISDMRMPSMDGADFLIHAKNLHPHTPRILLTGHADFERSATAINEAGIWRLFSKPWNEADLIQAVEQALSHRLLAKEKRSLEILSAQKTADLIAANARLAALAHDRNDSLAQANDKLARKFSTMVRIFGNLIDERFPNFRSSLTARTARAAAIQLNMPREDIEKIERAARLRLIGLLPLSNLELVETSEDITGLALYGRSAEMLIALEDLDYETDCILSLALADRTEPIDFDRLHLGGRIIEASAAFAEAMGSSDESNASAIESACMALSAKSGKTLCPKAARAVMAAFGISENLSIGSSRRDSSTPTEHEVFTARAMSGMVLSRDVRAPSGSLLLTSSTPLTPALLTQLGRLRERWLRDIKIWVWDTPPKDIARP
jgi:CheY-like chemotaxis protein